MILLITQSLGVRFGGLLALDNLNLALPEGGLYGLIGPNGAGKTTVFNLLSGFLKPTQGTMAFAGQDLHGWPPHLRTRLGVARTFQNIRLFEDLSVLDNVLVGLHCRRQTGWWDGLLHSPRYRREERGQRRQALALLEEVDLKDAALERAGQLPYGHQRRLEIARALASEPRLLLLDEPASGLDQIESDRLGEMILALRSQGLTILLVEHDMSLTMEVAEEIVVLNYGQLLAEGPPRAIQKHPEVIAAYLGSDWQT